MLGGLALILLAVGRGRRITCKRVWRYLTGMGFFCCIPNKCISLFQSPYSVVWLWSLAWCEWGFGRRSQGNPNRHLAAGKEHKWLRPISVLGGAWAFVTWYPWWSFAQQRWEQCAVQFVTDLTSILNRDMRSVLACVSVFICRLVHMNERDWITSEQAVVFYTWITTECTSSSILKFSFYFRIAL